MAVSTLPESLDVNMILAFEDLTKLPPSVQAGIACEYAAKGDLETLRMLVKAGLGVTEGTPYDQRTPLHLVAAAGFLSLAKFLVEECGATLRRDRFGLLPIHDAVHNGHSEVRRYLQSAPLHDLELDGGELMIKVFELVVKEGVFSYTTVHSEVRYYFKEMNWHPMYWEHFTPLQISKHVQCLIASKRVAHATDDLANLDFVFKSESCGFYLTTIGCKTSSQQRTEERISADLFNMMKGGRSISLKFMASMGSAFPGGQERLGIYAAEQTTFEQNRTAEGEKCLEVLASAKFIKEKSKFGKEQYQILMDDIVTHHRAAYRCIPGDNYPGPHKGGFVILFGTAETCDRHFFLEICQAMRSHQLSPRRFYLETFANGVYIYSLFFLTATEEDVHAFGRTMMYSTFFTGKSDVIFNSVMSATISNEVGLYLMAGVNFAYAFFPKEQYARDYMDVHKVLEKDPGSQRQLEALYKLCVNQLLSTERIYELVSRHIGLAVRFFDDFRKVAMGESTPHYSLELSAAIDAACTDVQDRQILKMFLTFNESILLTNFFKSDTPSAFAFRLNPSCVLKGRPTSLYPEVPYAIYLIYGRDFLGFHTRFRDVARGGLRLINSRDNATHERNFATLFDECYNLAITQQAKNKDIPEGGAKGVILPDKRVLNGKSSSPETARSCFTRYVDSLLDCMLPEKCGIYSGHMHGKSELLYFGPDENTAGFMDLGAHLGESRGYPYWKALTTGKSVKLGGVPHDTYGMTTASVHTYVMELLRELGEDEEKTTKFQTGGPDGDLGSNEILVSKDKTIAVVDGSGVLYDPAGINRPELVRLAKQRLSVNNFDSDILGPGGFLVKVNDINVCLPNGSRWQTGAELRDQFHLTEYATADLFVPCGGRPNAVTADNVKYLFSSEGRPKFRMIVEGANLFFSAGARKVLEEAGVHVFKDASTNKGGVTSSSLEVFAALALPVDEHSRLMTYNPTPGMVPPEFYSSYVQGIVEKIKENAKLEFQAIWRCYKEDGVPKVEATQRLSRKINQMTDSIQATLEAMTRKERDRIVCTAMHLAVPGLMVQHLGIEGILERVPRNYVGAIVAAWVASRFVYQYGINASEVSFFLFMKSLTEEGKRLETPRSGRKKSAVASLTTERPTDSCQPLCLSVRPSEFCLAADCPVVRPGLAASLRTQVSVSRLA